MKELSDEIEKAFEDHKDIFKKALIPVPVHYRWVDDGCPYDHSGELIEDGLIDLDQTLNEFLLFEYSGYKTPTFDSGCGFRYDYYHELIDREFCSGRRTRNSDVDNKSNEIKRLSITA